MTYFRFSVFLLVFLFLSCNRSLQHGNISARKHITLLLDNWHHAAAVADEDTFFGSMTADAIYLGTDASERWLRDSLKTWSSTYFEQESAWKFQPTSRTIYFSKNGDTAWFEELLTTWMGPCRGSGVLIHTKQGWKIQHYHLALTIDNDDMKEVLKVTKPN